ncbi:MAG: hypothetical protein HOK98_01265 [Rhodospirillaceae bacterium]|jgi:hypothetical protein|nr:hypothetical protein [Rhodospirillaceae bacterium]
MSDFSRVFLVGHSHYRALLLGLARRFKAEFSSEIHIYCATEQERAYWKAALDDATVQSVNVDNYRYRTADQPVGDPQQVLETARRVEAYLGLTINKLAVSDRHLGRGYALAGFKHPRSRRSENSSYLQMVNGFCAQVEFWRKEFEDKCPTLVLTGGSIEALIARKQGVAFRTIAGSRYQDYHQWVHNEFFENPFVQRAFEAVEEAADTQVENPYGLHMTLRRKFVQDVGLLGMMRRSAHIAARHVYWRLRGYEKARGYYPLEEIAYVWRRRRDLRALDRMSQPLASLEGRPFVYYPLHTEPETALQSLSPEYFYQHSCIAALSRDLPAGVMLAVKETYEAVGRRPTDFYGQLADFKNVVILDSMELGLEVVNRANAVATITGTGGFEAAVMGKPVVTFGCHNQYNFLDHVHVIEDEGELARALRTALADDAVNDTTRRDGARFLAATLASSFDLSGLGHLNVESLEGSAVELSFDALCASVRAGSETHQGGQA